tara:strand:- start:541 stop:1752 length:1212 start_codon:yes stop_codon:yes gene_type:complete
MTNDVFLLNVTVSSKVRQTIQFKMKDLQLPHQTIETLEEHGAVSIRPNLSNLLKEFLSELRLEQSKIYLDHCISHGESHFLMAHHFTDAMAQIRAMRSRLNAMNEALAVEWYSEMRRWEKMVNKTIEPLFADPESQELVKAAYMNVFPEKEAFAKAIEIDVVGPLPVSLDVASSPGDTLQEQMAYEAACNTQAVYTAAQKNAKDKALKRFAVFIDDLDIRISTNVGDRQTGGNSDRRGSWEVAAEELAVIADHVPGLDLVKEITHNILNQGRRMKNSKLSARERSEAFTAFNRLREELRTELTTIVGRSESTEGMQALQTSLSVTSEYQNILSGMKHCETNQQLEEILLQAETFTLCSNQRVKAINQAAQRQREFIAAKHVSVDQELETIEEIKNQSEEDIDF